MIGKYKRYNEIGWHKDPYHRFRAIYARVIPGRSPDRDFSVRLNVLLRIEQSHLILFTHIDLWTVTIISSYYIYLVSQNILYFLCLYFAGWFRFGKTLLGFTFIHITITLFLYALYIWLECCYLTLIVLSLFAFVIVYAWCMVISL